MPEAKRSQRLFEVDQVPGQWAMLRIFGIKLLLPLRHATGTPCLEVCGWRPGCRITQYNFRTHKRNQEFVREPIYVNDPMEDARMWPHHPSPLEFEIATVAVCRTKRYNFQCVPMMKQARCVLDQIHATVRFATELRLVQLPASLTPNGPNGPNHFLVIGTRSEVSHCLGDCYFACDGGMHLQFCKAKTHATEAFPHPTWRFIWPDCALSCLFK